MQVPATVGSLGCQEHAGQQPASTSPKRPLLAQRSIGVTWIKDGVQQMEGTWGVRGMARCPSWPQRGRGRERRRHGPCEPQDTDTGLERLAGNDRSRLLPLSILPRPRPQKSCCSASKTHPDPPPPPPSADASPNKPQLGSFCPGERPSWSRAVAWGRRKAGPPWGQPSNTELGAVDTRVQRPGPGPRPSAGERGINKKSHK